MKYFSDSNITYPISSIICPTSPINSSIIYPTSTTYPISSIIYPTSTTSPMCQTPIHLFKTYECRCYSEVCRKFHLKCPEEEGICVGDCTFCKRDRKSFLNKLFFNKEMRLYYIYLFLKNIGDKKLLKQ